ncbi:hypothetical protein [Devosia sp. 1635]|uniref:hypothetical protein n=1 Tax=Devosia sp. 1635 TaxID=2726066 RepID=UPI00156521F1|nr:hypothetical protein [Devosia sp. 1635]
MTIERGIEDESTKPRRKLDPQIIKEVLDFTAKHLEPEDWLERQVPFIKDDRLTRELNQAFRSARYIEKLGLALEVEGDMRHPHLKYQIVQYASIYEAIVSYLLFNHYKDHPVVGQLLTETVLVTVAPVSKSIADANDGSQLLYCKKKSGPRDATYIRFEDKLKAAERIGFLKPEHKPEILAIYKTRNAIHLESAVKNSVTYEAKQSRVAYERLKPFLTNIAAHLKEADGTPTSGR